MRDYYYFLLTKEQKALYLTLRKYMGYQRIPHNATVPDIHAAVKALLLDCPELCFFEGKWGYRDNLVYPLYVLPSHSACQLTTEVKRISEQFSDRSYPRQVYDWMLAQIEYCTASANSQNAYGALLQRQAACKGIAKGYQLLMRERNIDCILVEGTLDGKMNHVWNMILYEGRWTHVDVTMGYPCFWPLAESADAYGGYCRTLKELSASHKVYHPEILPAETQKR